MASIYIHFPFCISKCYYCDFNSSANSAYLIDDYEKAVVLEIENTEHMDIETIYLGGGTPSLIDISKLEEILNAVYETFTVAKDVEITIEANPKTADSVKLESFLDLGINRLSIGVQSLNDEILKSIGRTHTSHDALKIIEQAKEAGFKNLSADMMIGLPGQTMPDIKNTLKNLIDTKINHISAYTLKLEENTPLYNMNKEYPDEETEREMYKYTVDTLAFAGFMQYETSNFAKEGFISKHNMSYWIQKDYIGIGVSAHSFYKNMRCCNIDSIAEYISLLNNNLSPVKERILISEHDLLEEYIMLRLRLNEGIIFLDFAQRFGIDFKKQYADAIEKCITLGLICANEKKIYPTHKGFDLQNSLILEFLK